MKRRILALALVGALFLSLAACAPDAAEPTSSPTPVPVEELVTIRHRVEYDRPEDYRLDITIPMLREDLPGAAELNDQIAAHYDYYLNTAPQDYLEDGDCLNFAYAFFHLWYEVYTFGQLYEIVIRDEEYSLYGSGIISYNTVYCYDAEAGAALPLTDFLDRIGISQADVVAAAQAAYDDSGTYVEDTTFDQWIHYFYIDQDKQIQIEVDV